MTRHGPASARAVLIITGLVVASVCLGVTLWMRQMRDVQDAAAQRELMALSALLADHSDRTLQCVDLTLGVLASEIGAKLADGSADAASLHLVLRNRLAGIPQIRSALVLDETGRSLADHAVPVPRAFTGADRAYFTAHRARGDVGLFIGDPVRSRINGLWAISVSRRLSGPDGSFAGVIVAAVDPDYFTLLYTSAIADPDAAVSLLKRSGVVLATTHAARDLLLGTPGASPLIDGLTNARRGIIAGTLEISREERVAAYETARLYPLVVLVSRSRAGIQHDATATIRLVVGAGALISVLAMAIGWLLLRRFQSMESRFRVGIEAMQDGFLLWDANERLVAWNSAYEKLMPVNVPLLRVGLDLVDLVRWSVPRVRPDVAPDEIETLLAARLDRFRNPGDAWEVVLRGGRIVEVKDSRTSDGGGVTTIRDITAQKHHAAALQAALDAEREATLLQRRFVAMASHEFRTPLAIIDGAAQRLAAHRLAADIGIGRRVERIRGAVARLVGLIDRTLSSSKLEAGQIEFHPETLDLAVLLREVCAVQRQLSPGFEIALLLPAEGVTVAGDPKLLEQVFTNLLSNAVKYSGHARRIEVRAAPSARDVEIAVQDHGVGVAADEIGHLFGRFFRARTAMGISGTGIGLHLVRELVALHGGDVDVASILDRGSTFTIRLPRKLPERCNAAAA